MADLTQAPESAGDAIVHLGEWLADDVQTPTREEIKLARSVALALAEIKRLSVPQQFITTADQIRALPVGAVLLDAEGDAWQRVGIIFAHVASGGHYGVNSHGFRTTVVARGPFRVLYTPGGDRA